MCSATLRCRFAEHAWGPAHRNDSASLSGSCWAEGDSGVAPEPPRPVPWVQLLPHMRYDTPGSNNALSVCFRQADGCARTEDRHTSGQFNNDAGTDLQKGFHCLMVQMALVVIEPPVVWLRYTTDLDP